MYRSNPYDTHKGTHDTFDSGQQCAKQQDNRGSMIPVLAILDMKLLGRAHTLFPSKHNKKRILEGYKHCEDAIFYYCISIVVCNILAVLLDHIRFLNMRKS